MADAYLVNGKEWMRTRNHFADLNSPHLHYRGDRTVYVSYSEEEFLSNNSRNSHYHYDMMRTRRSIRRDYVVSSSNGTEVFEIEPHALWGWKDEERNIIIIPFTYCGLILQGDTVDHWG